MLDSLENLKKINYDNFTFKELVSFKRNLLSWKRNYNSRFDIFSSKIVSFNENLKSYKHFMDMCFGPFHNYTTNSITEMYYRVDRILDHVTEEKMYEYLEMNLDIPMSFKYTCDIDLVGWKDLLERAQKEYNDYYDNINNQKLQMKYVRYRRKKDTKFFVSGDNIIIAELKKDIITFRNIKFENYVMTTNTNNINIKGISDGNGLKRLYDYEKRIIKEFMPELFL